jgi:hypothetical protein
LASNGILLVVHYTFEQLDNNNAIIRLFQAVQLATTASAAIKPLA